jgi:hypothetical protein
MSTPTIELVWAQPGPPLTAARLALQAALAEADALPAWEEWKTTDPRMPRQLRSSGVVPRLYVNGRLAWTAQHGWSDVSALARTIVESSAVDPLRRTADPMSRRLKYVLLPSAALALLPKCPLCWMAYAGVTAAFGLTPLAARQSALIVLTLSVAWSVLAVIARARQIGDRAVLWPLVAGAALVVAGSHLSPAPALAYSGLSLMLGAALWSAWPRAHVYPPIASALASRAPAGRPPLSPMANRWRAPRM